MTYRGRTVRRLALAGLVMASAGMTRPAFASDDGYENVFTSVLTAVGVMSAEKSPEIDYRERAPLVVPPGLQLSKPQQPGAVRSASWPNDADVARRKKAAEDAKAPVASVFNHTDDHPMSKDEQIKYRAAQAPQEPAYSDWDSGSCPLNSKSMVHCRVNPDEMKAEEERFKKMNPDHQPTLEAGVEPDRLYLTQPPKGYLKPTKVVSATHEAPEIKRDDSGALSTYIHPDTHKDDPLQ